MPTTKTKVESSERPCSHAPDRISLSQVAREFETHLSTVHRWARKGVRVRNSRVVLESQRVGGRWYTTRPQVDRFLKTCDSMDDTSATTSPSPSGRADAAVLACKEAGL